jgi:hypothetical protein
MAAIQTGLSPRSGGPEQVNATGLSAGGPGTTVPCVKTTTIWLICRRRFGPGGRAGLAQARPCRHPLISHSGSRADVEFAMPYYGVLIRGSGVWLRMLKRRWLGLRQETYQEKNGFYTTRFVQAESPEEAERQVLAAVPDEVRAIYANRQGEAFQLFIEEITELQDEPEGPRSGFTFFAEGDGLGETRPDAQ